MKIQRTITVPLVVQDCKKLREIAATSARFANDMLSARYLKAKKLNAPSVYVDYSQDLSANVRDAMTKEVQAVWGKFAKRCLAGHFSLPIFQSVRALCIRDRGVEIVPNGDDFTISLQLLPKGNEWFSYSVYSLRLKKDLYLRSLLSRLANGEHRITKGAVVFDRRNPKRVAIRISYEREINPESRGEMTARLGPVGPDGELYIRTSGKVQSLTHYVQALQNKKRDLAGIWQRIRLSKKRHAMRNCERFEDWSLGVLHQMSRTIVQFAANERCGIIEWRIDLNGDLPLAKLKTLILYKSRELGIEVQDEKSLIQQTAKEGEKWISQTKKLTRELGQILRKM